MRGKEEKDQERRYIPQCSKRMGIQAKLAPKPGGLETEYILSVNVDIVVGQG